MLLFKCCRQEKVQLTPALHNNWHTRDETFNSKDLFVCLIMDLSATVPAFSLDSAFIQVSGRTSTALELCRDSSFFYKENGWLSLMFVADDSVRPEEMLKVPDVQMSGR